MELKEYNTAATVDFTQIPIEVFTILAKIVLRAAANSNDNEEVDRNAELW